MDLYMKCSWKKNKSSWNERLMKHENHIRIEMMREQKKNRAEEQERQQHHFMIDECYAFVQSVR